VKAKIVMTQHGIGSLELDGQKVDGVTRIRFSVGVDELNKLIVELVPDEIDLLSDPIDVTTIGDTARRYRSGKPESEA
jgi:hypothetical protein